MAKKIPLSGKIGACMLFLPFLCALGGLVYVGLMHDRLTRYSLPVYLPM